MTAAARFKAKLAANETTLLLNPDYPSPGLVEFCGTLGADAVMIDCEQGNAGLEVLEDMARAARLAGIASVVRVPSPEPWTIERHMFRGVDGIVIPRLDTAAQVRRAVEDIRYCFPKAFDQKLVIIQVESASAVAELEGFLEVPGIDCLFIGGVDLAKSMGFAGDYTGPEMVRAIEETTARIRRAGKPTGMMVKPHDIGAWKARGPSMLYAHINDFLAMGAKAWLDRAGMRSASP
jgi:2-keto-3-deoxy-L-rhamnonate aldolase RhmA